MKGRPRDVFRSSQRSSVYARWRSWVGCDKSGVRHHPLCRKTPSFLLPSQHHWYGLQYLNVIQITYSPAAAITKCTILLLYLRVFTPRRWDKLSIIIKTFILIVCLFYVALSLSKICQCVPRERIWNKTVPGKCLDLPVLLDSSGLFNIISDVCILLVPLKGVWHLQMTRGRKIGVYMIFTVGAM